MEFFTSLWNLFVQAIGDALIFINAFVGSPGLAIIVLTILIKLLLLPLTFQSLRSAKAMQQLQPALRDIQKRYAKDREKLGQETMKLYQEHKVNPLGGCLPMVVQIPVFFGLYRAIWDLSTLNPSFQGGFLWLPSLAHPDPIYALPILAGIAQFVQQRMMMPSSTAAADPQQQAMNRMMQFMPLMIVVFAWNFASGPVIYWVTSSVFAAVQQYFVTGWGSLPDLMKMFKRGEQKGGKSGTRALPASRDTNGRGAQPTGSSGLLRAFGMGGSSREPEAGGESRVDVPRAGSGIEPGSAPPSSRSNRKRRPRK